MRATHSTVFPVGASYLDDSDFLEVIWAEGRKEGLDECPSSSPIWCCIPALLLQVVNLVYGVLRSPSSVYYALYEMGNIKHKQE